MKRLIAVLTVFAGCAIPTTVCRANDVDDVKAEYARHIANANAGNVDVFIAQHMPGHTAFGPDGGMLSKWESAEEEKKGRPDLSKPANPQTRVHHMDAQVYNGNAAVVTAYLRAPVTLTDGTSRLGTRRVTSVWVKQNGKWIEVHDHMSTLITMRPQ